MAKSATEKKIIKLRDLLPANYRLWAAQSEATFDVHDVLDIVLGRELRPATQVAISSNTSDASGALETSGASTAAQNKSAAK